MAELTGILSPGDIDEVYSRTAIDLGTRMKGDNGSEYIFLKGVASCVAGSWVTYDEEFDTTLLVTAAKGPVAVAMAAIVADKYGWFCIFGGVKACIAASSADNAVIGFETTSGYAGDGATGGDIIYNAVSRSATGAAAEVQTQCQIWYPWVDAETAAH